jgi:PPM family protein phosphatase
MSGEHGQDPSGAPSGEGAEAEESRKRRTSTPLMEAAAQAAEQAHEAGSDGKSAEARTAGSGGGSDAGRQVSSEATTDPPPGEAGAPSGAEDPKAPAEAPADEAGAGIRVRYFGATNVGLVREHNEDNFMAADLTGKARDLPEGAPRTVRVGDRGLVLAVCDGMGGAAAGEVASQMAVDTIHEVMQAADAPSDRDAFARRLVKAVEEAGSRIFSAAKMDRTRRGMGTTATAAALVDQVLFVGQVGDSRAYVLRGEELGLITKDQSLVNQLIEAGQLSEEEAEAFEHSNIILQALGTTEDVNVDLTFIELRRGERMMLCSDGLSGMVHSSVIRDVLRESSNLEEAARKLIDMANASGGHDNVTVVVAEFDGEGLAPAEGGTKPAYQQYPLPEDEDGPASIPPREPSMKKGGPKPGADVKRGSAWNAPSAERDDDSSARWWLVAALVALAFVALMLLMSAPSMEDEGRRGAEAAGVATKGAAEAAEAADPVRVIVRSDARGAELMVDGKSYGRLDDEGEVAIFLPPGAYRFEARSDESVVASASATVAEDQPTEVELMLPAGRSGTPAAEEEAPTPPTRPAGEGEGAAVAPAPSPARAPGPAAPQPGTTASGEARRKAPQDAPAERRLPENPF